MTRKRIMTNEQRLEALADWIEDNVTGYEEKNALKKRIAEALVSISEDAIAEGPHETVEEVEARAEARQRELEAIRESVRASRELMSTRMWGAIARVTGPAAVIHVVWAIAACVMTYIWVVQGWRG